MRNNSFLTSLTTLLELLLGAAGIYFGVSSAFPHPFLNIACLITGVFVLLKAFDDSDKHDGRGKYNQGNNQTQQRR